MSIPIESGINGSMPHLSLDVLGRYALVDKQTCAGVAQIMKA
jgi:hypothetical protein